MVFRLLLLIAFLPLLGCNVGSTNDLAPGDLPAHTHVAKQMPLDPADADARARELVVEQNWPGLSIAVGWRGDLVWTHAVGFADILEGRAMTPDTRMRIGSVTQAVSGAMIATLAMDALIDWDESILRYLPSLPDRYAGVTARALMQHTSGVRHHRGEREYLRRQKCESTGAQLDLFVEDPLVNPPGQSFSYSTYGWVLAGAVAEAAADASYVELLDNRVLKPLKMTQTGFQHTPEDARLYWPFMATNPSYGLEAASYVDLSCVAAGSGLLSTPVDLVRLGNALLSGDFLDSEQARVLMTVGRLTDGSSIEYGLGWHRQRIEIDGKEVNVYSVGSIPEDQTWMGPGVAGGTASLMLVPEYQLVLAAATNVTFARQLAEFNLSLAYPFIVTLDD